MALALDSPRIPNGNGDALWQGRDKSKFNQCECCPYGYHIDLDFVRFCDNVSQRNDASLSRERRRDRRRQRQSMEVLLGLTSQSFWNIEQQLPKIPQEPVVAPDTPDGVEKSTLVRDALHKAVQDFEDTLERTHKSTVNHQLEHIPDGFTEFPPEAASSGDTSLSSMSAVSSPVTPQDVDHEGGMSSAAHDALLQDFDVASIGSATSGHSHAALQNIRQQMALSLERMRDLEEQVKLIPVLQVHLAVAKEEKRKMSLLLQEKKLENSKLLDETEQTESIETCLSVSSTQQHKSRKNSKNLEKSGRDQNKLTRSDLDNAEVIHPNYSEQVFDTRDIQSTSHTATTEFSLKGARTKSTFPTPRLTTPEQNLIRKPMVLHPPGFVPDSRMKQESIDAGNSGTREWISAYEIRKQRQGLSRPRSRSVSEGSCMGEHYSGNNKEHNVTLSRREKPKRDVQIQTVRQVIHASTQSDSSTESTQIMKDCVSTQTPSHAPSQSNINIELTSVLKDCVSTQTPSLTESTIIPKHCISTQTSIVEPVKIEQSQPPKCDSNDSTFHNVIENTITQSVQAFDTYLSDSKRLMVSSDRCSHLNMFKDALKTIMSQSSSVVESAFSSVSSEANLIRDDIRVPLIAGPVSLKSLDSVTRPEPPAQMKKKDNNIYYLTNEQTSIDGKIDCNTHDYRCTNCNLHLRKKNIVETKSISCQSNLPLDIVPNQNSEKIERVKPKYNKSVCTQTQIISKNMSTNTVKVSVSHRRVGDSVPLPKPSESDVSSPFSELVITQVKEEREKRSSSHDRESRIPRPSHSVVSPTVITTKEKKFVRQTTYTKLDVPEVIETECINERSWNPPSSSVNAETYSTTKDGSSDESKKKSLPNSEGSLQWISATETSSSTTPSSVTTTYRAPLAPHRTQASPVHKCSLLSLESIIPQGSSEIQNDKISKYQASLPTDVETSKSHLPHTPNKSPSMTHGEPPPLPSFLGSSETQGTSSTPLLFTSGIPSLTAGALTLPQAMQATHITDAGIPDQESRSLPQVEPGHGKGAVLRAQTDTFMQVSPNIKKTHPQSSTLASSPILNVKKWEMEPLDDKPAGSVHASPTKPVKAHPVYQETRNSEPKSSTGQRRSSKDSDQPYSWESTYNSTDPEPSTGQQKFHTDASSSTCSDGLMKDDLLTLAASERPKRVDPSTKMRAALKVVNDLIEKSMTISDLGNTAKAANGIIQREWFQISSTPNADPHIVEDYLDHFEEMSSTLLTYVVNMADKAGNTAMHYALSQGNFDVVSILLDSKVCNINLPNAAGYTAVMLVSLAQIRSETHRCVLQRFLADADVNVRAQQHGQTALMLAVSHNRLDMVQLLIEGGADLNIQDDDGSTALMCAAEHGHAAIVQFLINQQDTDLNIKDVDGLTALDIALDAGHKDVGILLYAHKHFSRNNSPYSSLRGRRSKSATPTTRTASTPPPRTPSSPLPVRAPPRHSHD